MKNDTSIKSIKGLSQIIQQSYKDDFENTKLQLAKLANQQFLMHYVQLDHSSSLIKQYRHLYDPPTCPYYVKFTTEAMRVQQIKKSMKKSIEESYKFKINYFSKQQLKQLAVKKQKELLQKQKLSESRKQKRQTFYQNLKISRKAEFKNQQSSPIKPDYLPNKNLDIEQSIEEMFFRLQVIGQARDSFKKRWYASQSSNRPDQIQKIISDWNKNHRIMKQLLEILLQKLNKQMGMIEVFKQLKIGQQNSLLSGLSYKSSPIKSEIQKSLGSTRIDRFERKLTGQEKKTIYRFGSWFNKLLLDQRQLQYIQRHLR